MIKIVGFLVFILTFKAWAIVPAEELVIQNGQEDQHIDPLKYIFTDTSENSSFEEIRKAKLYLHTYSSGVALNESCSYYPAPSYSSAWMEKQAKRTIASTLQYLGLDLTTKAIGAYGKKLNLTEEEFKRLSSNLVKNNCSKNITVHSLKKLELSLNYYFKNPPEDIIPSIEGSPFATAAWKSKTEAEESRSREFDQAIKSFRSFCSWSGDVADYRMMAPYLNNRFVMARVLKHLEGVGPLVDKESRLVSEKPSDTTLQVVCDDLVCRKSTPEAFRKNFPLSIGSSGVETDLAKMYCHHFRFQDYMPSATIPEVKQWIKEAELEDPIFETNFFLSLMTGVPDLFMGVEKYKEIPFLVKSSIDDRWNRWSNNVLSVFSQDLLFEESIKVRANPQRNPVTIRTNGLHLDFSITLGEMDRLLDETDKLKARFELKFSKNFLRSMKTRWINLGKEVDVEGQNELKIELARYVDTQLKDKEKLFQQKMWNEDFSRFIIDELLSQVLLYEGPMFDSYKDAIIKVPVKFSYGLFALSYLRYRADVKADRLKLDL